jgi:putative sigma-54 modulation protein
MNIQIKTKGGLALTPAITEYVHKRIASFEKFLAGDSTAQVSIELGRSTNHHKHGDVFSADVHLVAKGKDLFAGAEKEDLYAAIDAIKDEVLRELSNAKEKRLSAVRRGGAKVKNIIKGMWR